MQRFITRFLLGLIMLPASGMAAPQMMDAQQRSAAFQHLEDRAVVGGGQVSVIVRIDDQGAFQPGRPVNKEKLRAAQDAFLKKLGGNVVHVSRFQAFPLLAYTVDTVGLAMMKEDEQVLDVQENKIAAFDEGDASLMRSLADHVAVALTNARLFDEVSRPKRV